MISLEIDRFTSVRSYTPDHVHKPPTPPIIIDFHATVDKTALEPLWGPAEDQMALKCSRVEP